MKFENMRAETVKKWGIKYNVKNKKYYSKLSQKKNYEKYTEPARSIIGRRGV